MDYRVLSANPVHMSIECSIGYEQEFRCVRLVKVLKFSEVK